MSRRLHSAESRARFIPLAECGLPEKPVYFTWESVIWVLGMFFRKLLEAFSTYSKHVL